MKNFAEKSDKNGEKTPKNDEKHCPDCEGTDLNFVGRCVTCMECGWSACSL